MKINRPNPLFLRKVRNLYLPAFFIGLFIVSGTVADTETGIQHPSGDVFGSDLLMVVAAAILLAGLVIAGLISWGHRQNSISEHISDDAYDTRAQDL